MSGVWLDRQRRIALMLGALASFATDKRFRREFYISLADLVERVREPEDPEEDELADGRRLPRTIIEKALKIQPNRQRAGVNIFLSAERFGLLHPQFSLLCALLQLADEADIEVNVVLCGDPSGASEYDARMFLQGAGGVSRARHAKININQQIDSIRLNKNDLNISLDNPARHVLLSTLIYHQLIGNCWHFEVLGDAGSRLITGEADRQFELRGGEIRRIVEHAERSAGRPPMGGAGFRRLPGSPAVVPRRTQTGPIRLLILAVGRLSEEMSALVDGAVERLCANAAAARQVEVRRLSTVPDDAQGELEDRGADCLAAFDLASLSDAATWADVGLVLSDELELPFATCALSALGLPTAGVAVAPDGGWAPSIQAPVRVCRPTVDGVAASLADLIAEAGDGTDRAAPSLRPPVVFDLDTLKDEWSARIGLPQPPAPQPAGGLLWSSAVSGFGLRYRVLSSGSGPYKGTVCVFIHFDRNHVIDAYVLHYIEALKLADCEIVFVSSSSLADTEVSKITTFCRDVIIRDNIGLDFSGWALALEHMGDLGQVDELLIVNDSVYGPIGAFGELLDRMRAADGDVVGVVESREIAAHLQSWFLMFKKPALQSSIFASFWNSVLPLTQKEEIITRYEVALAERFRGEGVRVAAVASVNPEDHVPTNPTHAYWRTLLKMRIPFIKVQLLRDNPIAADIRGWDAEVESYGYDPNLIINHLRRVGGRAGLSTLVSRSGTEKTRTSPHK